MLEKLFVSLVPVGVVLITSEVLWRRKMLLGERARKFIHILAGVWIALWPLYLPLDGIMILGCMMLTFVLATRGAKPFHAMYDIKRRTYGDIFYAGALILCAYFARASWIFTTAILTLALADGGAALAGKAWGKTNEYYVFAKKQLKKSIAGTIAYIVFAVISLIVGFIMSQDILISDQIILLTLLPFALAAIENVSPYGVDNVITPLAVVVILNGL